MYVVLFDLGNTLVKSSPNGYKLIPNSLRTVQDIGILTDHRGDHIIRALVIDSHTKEEKPFLDTIRENRKNMIIDILNRTGLQDEFNPLDIHMTLSSEIGFTKSEDLERFINIALKKTNIETELENVILVTEEKDHVTKAKSLGLKTIHLTEKEDQQLLEDEINNISKLTSKIIEIVSR
jgi:FMN phosphatase YigB (HAD superfamily)